MTALPPPPDQLFVLDRAEDTDEFLDMLLALCTFGINTGLLLVDSGVEAVAAEHRGIPVAHFQGIGLGSLMVEARALKEAGSGLPASAVPVDQQQIRDLYRRVPRIIHP